MSTSYRVYREEGVRERARISRPREAGQKESKASDLLALLSHAPSSLEWFSWKCNSITCDEIYEHPSIRCTISNVATRSHTTRLAALEAQLTRLEAGDVDADFDVPTVPPINLAEAIRIGCRRDVRARVFNNA